MSYRIFNAAFLAAVLGGCATAPAYDMPVVGDDYTISGNAQFAAIASGPTKPARDLRAILAMQGDYHVDFEFQETVRLAPGYKTHENKTTGGFETVFVVEQGDHHVILQHLLVTPGGHVIKHWRQDWTYEAAERFEFVAHQNWEVVSLDPEKTRGAWTQCVYEVSDAPRYCGTGTWNHRYGVSTWTSDRTWRPLPRREYTKRSDYNAINAQNRHTVTPHGWTHEQDNTKTQRDGRTTSHTLVREFGFNDYRSITGFDFAPAGEYWGRTSAYWSRVRDAWDRRMSSGSVLQLNTEVDGMPIIIATFQQAEKVDQMSEQEQLEAIEAVLDEWTTTQALVSRR